MSRPGRRTVARALAVLAGCLGALALLAYVLWGVSVAWLAYAAFVGGVTLWLVAPDD